MIHFYTSNYPQLPRIFRVISYAGILFCLIALCVQFISSRPSLEKNTAIVTTGFASLILLGFSYIVEAAIIYISKHHLDKEDEYKSSGTNN